MNKSLVAMLGIGACAAACAAALIVPALIGVGGLGLGAALTGASLEVGIIVALAAIGLANFSVQRRKKSPAIAPLAREDHGTSCAADGSCGCSPRMRRTAEY